LPRRVGGFIAIAGCGLLVSGEYLPVPAAVGFIALWGIAVLNGFVLVSYVRGLREAGVEQATVAALGLAPFLFAAGTGSEVERPLAIVVSAV
jgi:heavy metal efflux system protein